jgi:hypothetical protein
MIKRTLVIAAAIIAAHAGAAFADNNWTFDDPYWMNKGFTRSVEKTDYTASQVDSSFEKYKDVNGYSN